MGENGGGGGEATGAVAAASTSLFIQQETAASVLDDQPNDDFAEDQGRLNAPKELWENSLSDIYLSVSFANLYKVTRQIDN